MPPTLRIGVTKLRACMALSNLATFAGVVGLPLRTSAKLEMTPHAVNNLRLEFRSRH